MIPENLKKDIDGMTYYQLLDKWRFAPVGDPMFRGELGEYYSKVMFAKKNADPAGAVADSKALGWKRG